MVQLYKDGRWQNFDEYGYQGMLDLGWSLTDKEVEIIHTPCDKTVEECDCVDKEVEAVASGESEEATIEEVVEAISVLDNDNTEHWTSQGKPMVAAIETLLGKSLVAGQRDEAWKQIKAS